MTTHILAITYKPKEEAVRTGICRQTIRPKKPKELRCQDCQHEPDFGEPLSRDGKDWCYDCGFAHFKPREAGQKGDG